MGGNRGVDGEQGLSAVVNGVVNNTAWCRMQAVWVDGTEIGGVLLGLALYIIVLELPVVVLGQAEQGI
jgi:hypothetical protein